ncbi:hypothetical protein [Shinella zoogloeoides]|uniref:hypothetical protein n=1 Tax=Shinella zoogloeoides TaxID=352475 RepID=UPI00273F6496|nr:hypothetical protein [Shinella zoogloeoides]WLR93799.1 hypothetical protein Q9316_06315 [Shinella zoogloeoides]
MQDPNLVNRPPEDRATRPVDDRGPTVVNASNGSGTGGWAVAVILAVLVAVGIFYFVGSGTPGDGVDPNANTSAIGTQDSAPAGGTATDGQTGGTTGGTQPLESQPSGGQPAEGGGATTTTP